MLIGAEAAVGTHAARFFAHGSPLIPGLAEATDGRFAPERTRLAVTRTANAGCGSEEPKWRLDPQLMVMSVVLLILGSGDHPLDLTLTPLRLSPARCLAWASKSKINDQEHGSEQERGSE